MILKRIILLFVIPILLVTVMSLFYTTSQLTTPISTQAANESSNSTSVSISATAVKTK